MKLKEPIKSALIIITFYLIIFIGLCLLSFRNKSLDKKMTDIPHTQISQNEILKK